MRKIVLLFSIMFTPLSIADNSTAPQTIRAVSTGWGSEAIYVYTVENEVVENCLWASYRFDKDNPLLKEIVSIALSAYHSNSKVEIRVSGCSGDSMNAIAISVVSD